MSRAPLTRSSLPLCLYTRARTHTPTPACPSHSVSSPSLWWYMCVLIYVSPRVLVHTRKLYIYIYIYIYIYRPFRVSLYVPPLKHHRQTQHDLMYIFQRVLYTPLNVLSEYLLYLRNRLFLTLSNITGKPCMSVYTCVSLYTSPHVSLYTPVNVLVHTLKCPLRIPYTSVTASF